MKSTTILCLALPLFILGTALSLVVYARDINESHVWHTALQGTGYEQPLPQDSAIQPAAYIAVDAGQTGNGGDASAGSFLSGIPGPALFAGKEHLEPAAIFLFGAGVAGLASFTRRKLNV